MTKYEALVYIALLRVRVQRQARSMNRAVSRAHRYTRFGSACWIKDLVSVSQSAPKRFAAIPPDEAIARLMDRIEQDATWARDSFITGLSGTYQREQGTEELIWNIYGIENIQNRLNDLHIRCRTGHRIIAHPRIFVCRTLEKTRTMANHIGIKIITPQGLEVDTGRI